MQRTENSRKKNLRESIYGYMCMPMGDADRDVQLLALKKFPVRAKNIYDDGFLLRGKERPEYQKLANRLKKGDTLVVHSLGCLGRDYNEILEQWRMLTQEKGVKVVILDIPLLGKHTEKENGGMVPSGELVEQLLLCIAKMEAVKQPGKDDRNENKARGPQTYGYVRVSSRDQCEERQLIAMRGFSVRKENIFIDKLSGKDFNRPQYQCLLHTLKAGDTLVIQAIDRLGRNYEEILEQWRMITKEKQVNIVVLDMPLLNTGKTGNGLTGIFVEDLVLQILSYVAQTERENIRKRQREGIAAAKQKGARFGRPRKHPPASYRNIKEEWTKHTISSREAARELGVSQNTFLRWVTEC